MSELRKNMAWVLSCEGSEPDIIINFHCLSREFEGLSNQNLEINNLCIKIQKLLCRKKFRPETDTGFLMYLI